MVKYIIWDNDGTLTDAEKEIEEFHRRCKLVLANFLKESFGIIRCLWNTYEGEVFSDPLAYPLIFNGNIVGPATEPYTKSSRVIRKILDHYNRFQDEAEMTRFIDKGIYGVIYAEVPAVFRPHVRQVFLSMEKKKSCIISNTLTDFLEARIQKFGTTESRKVFKWVRNILPSVYGNARKLEIDDSFDAVKKELWVPGLHRPMLLRRPAYYNLLTMLLQEKKLKPYEVMVIGDVFEQDLALPWAMGFQIGLFVTDYTPQYERDYVEKYCQGCGHLFTDLRTPLSLLN